MSALNDNRTADDVLQNYFKKSPTDRNNPTDKKIVIRWVVSIRWECCFRFLYFVH
jgi:hypothetical protein